MWKVKCKSKGEGQHFVSQTKDAQSDDVLAVVHSTATRNGSFPTIPLECLVNGRDQMIECQFDTGATVSVMSSRLWKQLGEPILQPSTAVLIGYTDSHRFLFGREFTLVTDHRPLTHIFGQNSQLPERVSARLQRWAITLSGYSYVITYRKSAEMKSDSLSRLVAPTAAVSTHHVGRVPLSERGLLSLQEVIVHTQECPELRKLTDAIGTGQFNDSDIRSYKPIADELTVQDGAIIRGTKLVVPITLREKALAAAHGVHLGIARTKSLLREYWWPRMDKMVESRVGTCQVCRTSKPRNRNFCTSWPKPEGPWTRVHVDFAGPIEGHYLLVLVDAYSGYPEVHLTKDMTSTTVVNCFRRTFAQQGVPNQLVSDNGPSFVSEETRQWLTRVGCNPITTPAYHPQSNGLAERFVRTIKEAIRANGLTQAAIDRYLLFYRASVGVGGASPAELLVGRKLRAPLLTTQVTWKPGENLVYRAGQRVQEATLVCPKGSNTAIIKVGPEKFKKAHLDQLQRFRPRKTSEDQTERQDSSEGSHPETAECTMRGLGPRQDEQARPCEPGGVSDTEVEPETTTPEAIAPSVTKNVARPQTAEQPEVRRSSRLQAKPRIDYKE
ncbi:hypothetical protein BOX15_Mlig014775g1 [Macrostomum lignano]|uniref:Integrase catalytic domain-containing protein n=1 Tax=Macrostomum lignano TaxID=282301 RepID=A0A267H7Z1_9PLAT|nr:hypothetical protein BOX15_Mlig014775g1 [Macrostomum lignano]